MYSIPPKKMIIINILDILSKYSDEDHRLSQKQIADILENEYSMKVERKSIKRNLMNLIDFGYNINYTEINRGGNTDVDPICTDWYLERDFSESELRLLIDSLLFSKHIPYTQCKQLIAKLQTLASKYFEPKVRHVQSLPEHFVANSQLFYSIGILDEAIERNRQVSFSLGEIGWDKKRHVRKSADGLNTRFIFNPYQMVTTNGRYYLIGNFDKYDNVTYVRLDHIVDISLLEHDAKSKKKVEGLSNGLNLPTHMAEHIYMLYGNAVDVTFKASKQISDQIVDWFGKDFTVLEELESDIIVKVHVNERAMRFWALQYGNFVEILTPESLREKIIDSINTMTIKYIDKSNVLSKGGY